MAWIRDLDWAKKIDPNKVYDTLVEFAGASKHESSRNHFVSCWFTLDWAEWRFCGKLGFGGKLWREKRGFYGEGHVPNLRVSCYSEHDTEKTEKIVIDTNNALLKILIEARLRPNAQKV